jgi:hypothetical protein
MYFHKFVIENVFKRDSTSPSTGCTEFCHPTFDSEPHRQAGTSAAMGPFTNIPVIGMYYPNFHYPLPMYVS